MIDHLSSYLQRAGVPPVGQLRCFLDPLGSPWRLIQVPGNQMKPEDRNGIMGSRSQEVCSVYRAPLVVLVNVHRDFRNLCRVMYSNIPCLQVSCGLRVAGCGQIVQFLAFSSGRGILFLLRDAPFVTDSQSHKLEVSLM
jgi:hypothetical protein